MSGPFVIVAIALVVTALVSAGRLLRPMLRGGGLTLASGGLHPEEAPE